MTTRLPLLAAFILLVCGACAQTKVQPGVVSAPSSLPPPQIIVVRDLAPPPSGASLDQGLSARLERLATGGSDAAQQHAAIAAAQHRFTDALLRKLRKDGFAVLADDGAAPSRPALIVSGRFVTLDGGNRTRRLLVGFGAGASRATAEVDFRLAAPGAHPQLLRSVKVETSSGRKPGAAATLGVGAAAGRLAESAAVTAGASALSETRSAGVDDDAERMAEKIAGEISALYAARGWIAS
jgi:hypothetical protein